MAVVEFALRALIKVPTHDSWWDAIASSCSWLVDFSDTHSSHSVSILRFSSSACNRNIKNCKLFWRDSVCLEIFLFQLVSFSSENFSRWTKEIFVTAARYKFDRIPDSARMCRHQTLSHDIVSELSISEFVGNVDKNYHEFFKSQLCAEERKDKAFEFTTYFKVTVAWATRQYHLPSYTISKHAKGWIAR